jgi:SAM-dependent methyltransferase
MNAYRYMVSGLAIRPDSVLVDVGGSCQGIWPEARPRLGEDGRVVLLDLAEEGLRDALARWGDDPRLLAIRGDAARLPFGSGAVDYVTTRGVLIYVPDKATALREFARVIRPGGGICLCEPEPGRITETPAFEWGRWRAIRQAIEEMREHSRREPHFQAGMECEGELLVRLLQTSGLRAERCERARAPKHELGGPEAVLRMWKPPHLDREGYRPWHETLRERFSAKEMEAFARFVTDAVRAGRLAVSLPLVTVWARKPTLTRADREMGCAGDRLNEAIFARPPKT